MDWRHFQLVENEENQKPRFLVFVVKKAMDGLFQQPASAAGTLSKPRNAAGPPDLFGEEAAIA